MHVPHDDYYKKYRTGILVHDVGGQVQKNRPDLVLRSSEIRALERKELVTVDAETIPFVLRNRWRPSPNLMTIVVKDFQGILLVFFFFL